MLIYARKTTMWSISKKKLSSGGIEYIVKIKFALHGRLGKCNVNHVLCNGFDVLILEEKPVDRLA